LRLTYNIRFVKSSSSSSSSSS